MDEERTGGFTVRCRECARTVLSGVARLGDAEAAVLRAHVARCRPATRHARDDSANADLGTLLARFDVATTGDGA